MSENTNRNASEESEAAEKIINAVRDIFDARGWMYNYNPITGTISASFQIEDGDESNNLIMMISVVRGYLLNCCQLPLLFSSERLPSIAEYLHRVNYRLMNGCFELDYASLQCRYKTALPIKGMLCNSDVESLLSDTITLPCTMWEFFGAGLNKVVKGDAPIIALRSICADEA